MLDMIMELDKAKISNLSSAGLDSLCKLCVLCVSVVFPDK